MIASPLGLDSEGRFTLRFSNGLTLSSDELVVNAGDGLDFNSGVLVIDAGDGLAFDSGTLEVDVKNSIEIDSGDIQLVGDTSSVNDDNFYGSVGGSQTYYKLYFPPVIAAYPLSGPSGSGSDGVTGGTPVGTSLIAAGSTITPVADFQYYTHLGQVSRDLTFTSITISVRSPSTFPVSEVGIFTTPGPPDPAGGLELTKVATSGITANSGGTQTATVNASVSAGDYVWLGYVDSGTDQPQLHAMGFSGGNGWSLGVNGGGSFGSGSSFTANRILDSWNAELPMMRYDIEFTY